MSESRSYMTVREASKYLKISIGSLYKMVREHTIPFHKINHKILFDQEELDLWIQRKTIREKEEKLNDDEKLLQRLKVYWDNLPLDTQDEINHRLKIMFKWEDHLDSVVEQVEKTKGHFRFPESQCLVNKQTGDHRPDPKSAGDRAQQTARPPQANPNQKVVQAGSGSSQTSGPDKPRRGHVFSVERHKKWRLARAQRRAALATSKPNDSIKENPPPKESPTKSEAIGVEAPAKEEKPPKEVLEPQETVPAEQPSSGPDLPSDQPGEDPLSHAQTVDPLDPDRI